MLGLRSHHMITTTIDGDRSSSRRVTNTLPNVVTLTGQRSSARHDYNRAGSCLASLSSKNEPGGDLQAACAADPASLRVVSVDLDLTPPTTSLHKKRVATTGTLTRSQSLSSLNSVNKAAVDLDHICYQVRETMRDYTKLHNEGGVSNLRLVFNTRRKPALPKLPSFTSIGSGSSLFFGGGLAAKQRHSITRAVSSSFSFSSSAEDHVVEDLPSQLEELERIKIEREELKKRLRESSCHVDQLESRVQQLEEARRGQEQSSSCQGEEEAKSCCSSSAASASAVSESASGDDEGTTSTTESASSPIVTTVLSTDASEIRRNAKHILRQSVVLRQQDPGDETARPTPIVGAIQIVPSSEEEDPHVLQLPVSRAIARLPTSEPEGRRRQDQHSVLEDNSNNNNRNNNLLLLQLNQAVQTLKQEKFQLEETVANQKAQIDALTLVNRQQRQQLQRVAQSIMVGGEIPANSDEDESDSLPSSLESLVNEQEAREVAIGLSQLEEMERQFWGAQQTQRAIIQQDQDQVFPQLVQRQSAASNKIAKLCGALSPSSSNDNNHPKKEEEEETDSTVVDPNELLQSILEGKGGSTTTNLNDDYSPDSSYQVIEQCELAWMQQAQEIEELQRQQDVVLARLRAASISDEEDTNERASQGSNGKGNGSTEQSVENRKSVFRDTPASFPAKEEENAAVPLLCRESVPTTTYGPATAKQQETETTIEKTPSAFGEEKLPQEANKSHHASTISRLELMCKRQESSLDKLRKEKLTLSKSCEDLQRQLKDTKIRCDEQQSTILRLEKERDTAVQDLNRQTLLLENAHAVSSQQRETIGCLLGERQNMERILEDYRMREKELMADCTAQRKAMGALQDAKDDLTSRLLQKEEEFRDHLMMPHMIAQSNTNQTTEESGTKLVLESSQGSSSLASQSSTRSMDDDDDEEGNLNITEVSFQNRAADATSWEREGRDVEAGRGYDTPRDPASSSAADGVSSKTGKEKDDKDLVLASTGEKLDAHDVLQLMSFALPQDKLGLDATNQMLDVDSNEPSLPLSCTASAGEAKDMAAGDGENLYASVASKVVCYETEKEEVKDVVLANKLDAHDVLQLMSFALPEDSCGNDAACQAGEQTVDLDSDCCAPSLQSSSTSSADQAKEASDGQEFDDATNVVSSETEQEVNDLVLAKTDMKLDPGDVQLKNSALPKDIPGDDAAGQSVDVDSCCYAPSLPSSSTIGAEEANEVAAHDGDALHAKRVLQLLSFGWTE